VPFLLPNVPVHFTVLKPEFECHHGDDLASCLRRRRRELGLLQSGASARIGVCTASVWNWENGQADPEDCFYPAIIKFLGREPWPEPATFVERLRAQRRRLGLTVKAAAELIGIGKSTLASWEQNGVEPGLLNREKADAFLSASSL
jgi:transcriptional regulator with XRE-family HTH domain